MEELVSKILQAGADELEPLLNAVLQRYSEVFPDWEICTVSLQKRQDKVRQLDEMIAMLERLKALYDPK